jgi:hypothetical protein
MFAQSLKRISSGLVLGAVLQILVPTYANAGYFFIPWLSIDELYDDNLFYDSSNEVSDYITRISPTLEFGYDSQKLNWLTSYSVDADYYREQSELDSSNARQFAHGIIEYIVNERWTLAGEADYVKTDTPADLSLFPGGDIPGLQIGRTPAKRTYLRPEATYQFSPTKAGSLAYSLINDELIGITKTDTQTVEANLEHQLSAVNLVTYGYLYRHYRFRDESEGATTADSSDSSNTPWVGLTHDFSPNTQIIGRAGPIVSSGSTEVYLLLSLQHSYARGKILLDYVQDETTLLGEVGPVDSQSVDLSMTRQLSANLVVAMTAGYADVSQSGFSAQITSATLEARYQLNSYVFFTTSYSYDSQKRDDFGLAQDRVNHGVIQLGVTFTRPRRYPT